MTILTIESLWLFAILDSRAVVGVGGWWGSQGAAQSSLRSKTGHQEAKRTKGSRGNKKVIKGSEKSQKG